VGHVSGPLAFPPFAHCSWANRFDDPRREYRTLYAARKRLTCLRETLASRRPDPKTVKALEAKLGGSLAVAGRVAMDWRRENLLAAGHLELVEGRLVSLEDIELRRHLESELHDVLSCHGMERLDITETRSRVRPVSQTISRWLYERGVAAVVYRSNLDNEPCVALFEGRARLVPDGDPEPLLGSVRELDQVCRELGLVCTGI
jgi:hypothetical protein